MYLIQQVTKDSSGDIIMYFHHLATVIVEGRLKKKQDGMLNKNLTYTYRDSHIPYRMSVKTYPWDNGQDDYRTILVKVAFPQSLSEVDIASTIDKILESGLGLEGSTPVEPFLPPPIRIPLEVKSILKRPKKEIKDVD